MSDLNVPFTFEITVEGISYTSIHIWINDLNAFASRRLNERLLLLIVDNKDNPNSARIYDLKVIFAGTEDSINVLRTIIDNRKKWISKGSDRIKLRVDNPNRPMK